MLRYIFIIFSFLSVLILPVSLHAGEFPRPVLYISSYNPEFPTFFRQIEGIKSVLDGKNVALDVEFMDSRRFSEEFAMRMFHRNLYGKWPGLPHYRAIIAADDAALRYAIGQQNRLFRGIPVFFCGINDVPLALSLEREGRMRGTIEAISVKENLDLVKSLFPDRRKLAVITDGTVTGQADLKTLESESAGSGLYIEVLSLQYFSFQELNKKLESLGEDWSVLLFSLYKDRTGKTRLFEEGLDEIMQHTKVPVFHPYEHGLGAGIFGGKMVSHYEQGRAVAEMVLRYLEGVPLKDIAVPGDSPNRFMFDYNQLERFNVSRSRLPRGRIIINMPHSFIDVHPFVMLTAGMGILLLLITAVMLYMQKFRLAREVEYRTGELARSERRLHAAMKNAGQTIWEWNLVTDDLFLLRPEDESAGKGTKTLQVKAAEWSGRIHPGDRDRTLEGLNSYIGNIDDARSVFETVHRLKRSDGNYIWFISRGRISDKGGDGRPLRILGVSTDITRIKEIEDEIKSSRAMLQMVIDTIPIGVFWKDTDLKYIGCNNVFAGHAMLNSPEDIVGKRDGELTWHDMAPVHEAIDMEVITTRKRKNYYQEEMLTPMGERRYMRKLKAPLTGANGEVIGILGIQEDITEAKHMREQRVRMQKLESVGILAGGVAHDFNNMLMAISGSLSVLHLVESDEKKLHWIMQAEKSCSAAAEVTSRLITFARGGDPVKEPLYLPDLVRNVVAMDNAGDDIQIALDIRKDVPVIMADDRQIAQVLRNLIDNAREAVSYSGSISVSCGTAGNIAVLKAGLKGGEYVQFSVSDTGPGVNGEIIGQIFDPYFSTKNMSSQKGQGLGLTVCHSIVKNHGGAISAESVPGGATTFTVLLPVS